jgi:hypothetical protein
MAGNNKATSTPMMAMTTKSSTNVNPSRADLSRVLCLIAYVLVCGAFSNELRRPWRFALIDASSPRLFKKRPRLIRDGFSTAAALPSLD